MLCCVRHRHTHPSLGPMSPRRTTMSLQGQGQRQGSAARAASPEAPLVRALRLMGSLPQVRLVEGTAMHPCSVCRPACRGLHKAGQPGQGVPSRGSIACHVRCNWHLPHHVNACDGQIQWMPSGRPRIWQGDPPQWGSDGGSTCPPSPAAGACGVRRTQCACLPPNLSPCCPSGGWQPAASK